MGRLLEAGEMGKCMDDHVLCLSNFPPRLPPKNRGSASCEKMGSHPDRGTAPPAPDPPAGRPPTVSG